MNAAIKELNYLIEVATRVYDESAEVLGKFVGMPAEEFEAKKNEYYATLGQNASIYAFRLIMMRHRDTMMNELDADLNAMQEAD